MPSLKRLNEEFKDENFALITIDIQESRDTVAKYVSENGLDFINLLDPEGGVSQDYGVRSTPAKFIIDRDGNMVGATLGYKEWDTDEVKELIRKLISS